MPKHTLQASQGWLAPDGKLYACPLYGHIELAEILAREYELVRYQDLLQHVGFVKLEHHCFLVGRTLTQKQLDTIYDYSICHEKSVSDVLKSGRKISELEIVSYQEAIRPFLH